MHGLSTAPDHHRLGRAGGTGGSGGGGGLGLDTEPPTLPPTPTNCRSQTPFGGGGGAQVNKALHTRTSWYAHAAIVGILLHHTGQRCVYNLSNCTYASPSRGRVLSANTSGLCIFLYKGC